MKKLMAVVVIGNICFAATKSLEIFLRKIDTSHPVVFGDVAQNIRQLKRDPEFFRKFEGSRITESENVGATLSDGSGDAIAILSQEIERGIAVEIEIHERS